MGRLDWKTSPSYPDGVPTCRVTGTVVVPRADGVDADLVPDVDAFVGVIRFTPNVESQIRVLDAVEPLIFAPTVVEARFNGAGQVFGVDGVPGVVLPASLSDRLSPCGWSWEVSAEYTGGDEVAPLFEPFHIVTPVGANGAQGEIDLASVMPTAPDSGESLPVAFASAAQAAASAAHVAQSLAEGNTANAQALATANQHLATAQTAAQQSATSASSAATSAANSETAAQSSATSAAEAATSAQASATSAENAHQQLVTNPLELQGVPQSGGKVMVQWRRAGGAWADLGAVDAGADGVSVTGGAVNGEGHLVITLSNNSTVDVGLVRGLKGDNGDSFVYTDFTPEQLEGLRGPTGLTGPPPTLTAGPVTVQDGDPTVNVTGSGGAYTVGMTIPAPAGMTNQAITNLISQQTDQKFAELEVLALAALAG